MSALFCAADIYAYDLKSDKEEKDTVAAKSEYDKLFENDHESVSGLMTLHKVKDKLYLECPLDLLGRRMLLGSTVSRISDNTNAVVGSKPKAPPFLCIFIGWKETMHGCAC